MKYSKDDGICSAPQHGINLVSGEMNTRTCGDQRSVNSSPLYCGLQAMFFVQKPFESVE